ncbi:MAG: PQQ-binding-like beta-propeller repeat protein [Bryobacteraceae bacterium]
MILRLLLPVAILSLSHAEDWSRFRGPNGSGVSKDAGFPAEFGRERNAVWRTAVRPGKSSPVLTRDRIFLTGYEKSKLYTQCFDRKTGKLLWEQSQDRAREEDKNQLNEPAAITPVTDGENVYAFFGEFGLISYDAAGKVRWKAPLGPFTNIMGISSSPILAGDSVVVVADQQDDSYVAAFDRRNGEIRWKTAREEKDGWGTPLLYGGRGAGLHILTASRGQFGGHSAQSGARTLNDNILSPAIVASPVLVEDTVFTFGYGNESATPFSNQLAKLDKNQDRKLTPDEYGTNAFLLGIAKFEGNRDRIVTQDEWDEKQRQVLAPSRLIALRLERNPDAKARSAIRTRELWRYEKSFVGVIPSPLFYDGVVYVVKNGGILTSFDAATGEVAKTGRVPGALGGYSASPVAAEGKLYLATEEGKVAVLRAAKEWDVLALNDLGEGCYATPALSEGHIYLRTTEALYCFAGAARDRTASH